MGVYRYSDPGVDELVRKAKRQTYVLSGMALLLGFALAGYFNPDMFSLKVLPFLIFFIVPTVLFSLRSQFARLAPTLKSTEFEIDEDRLVARNSHVTIVVPRTELTEFKHTQCGIALKGRTAMQSVHLKRELENFDELAAQLESWAPPHVKRAQSAAWTGSTNVAIGLANVALFAAAFLVTDPAIAIACCLLESAILVVCGIVAWRFSGSSNQEWKVLVLFFPIMSLLSRALMLWPAND